MREREWEGSITTDGTTMTLYYINNGAVASRQVTGQNRARYEAKLTLSARLSDGRISGTYSYEASVVNTIRGNDGITYNVDRISLASRGNLSGGIQNDGSYILNFQGPAQESWRSGTVSSQQKATSIPSLGQFRAVIQ